MNKSEGVIRAYKGFDKNLRCLGFQYEVGKTYKHDGDVQVRESGFHACESPLHVFEHYPPANSRYCAVEQSGDIAREDDETASSEIRIETEIGIRGLISAHIDYTKSKTTSQHADPKAATAGIYGAATAGGGGAATAGNYGAATAGDYGAATAGDYGAATSRGCVSVGKNGCGLVRGTDVQIRGGLGAVLVICEETTRPIPTKAKWYWTTAWVLAALALLV